MNRKQRRVIAKKKLTDKDETKTWNMKRNLYTSQEECDIIIRGGNDMKSVYEIRKIGRDYCVGTEGSEHYKEGGEGTEPIDLMMAMGKDTAEGFFLGNIIKYAKRFKKTRDLNDLVKISDYAHLMCGLEIDTTKNK